MRQVPESQAVPAPLSAVELLVIGYRALSPVEQDEALERLQELRLERVAGQETETERMLASLQRVREIAGRSPTADDYRAAIQQEMSDGGPGLEPLSRVIRHFGTWRLAREALDLSEVHTARRIEAMFKNRRVGRVHQYTVSTLRDTLRQCAADLGHAPQTNEFKRWREAEIEKARAQGQSAFQLPGVGPYRRRYGEWERVLKACGFTEAEIAGRLERP